MARAYAERRQQIIDLTDYQNLFRPDKAPEATYREIVHALSKDSGLGFDPFQEQIATMVMTALSNTRRTRGSPYISPERSGNTAEHSAQTVVEWDHLFERVGISPDQSTRGIQKARRFGACAALVHDWGEILGEASVLSSRIREGGSIDSNGLGNVELDIAKYAIQLAAYCAEAGTPQYFYDKIAALTTEADVATHGYTRIPALLARERHTMEVTKAALKPEHAKAAQYFIELVEYAEQEKYRDFFHTLMKSVEHLQGTVAIMEHATSYVQGVREGREVYKPFIGLSNGIDERSSAGIPVVDKNMVVDSLFATGNFFYNEADLGYLWRLAGKDPEKQALAKQHIIDVYQVLIDYMERKCPVFRRLDHHAMPKEQLMSFAQKTGSRVEDAESYGVLLKQLRGFHLPDKTFIIPAGTMLPDGTAAATPLHLPKDALLPIETAARMKCLYQAAIALVKEDRFHPLPGEVLFTMDNRANWQAVEADPARLAEHRNLKQLFIKNLSPSSDLAVDRSGDRPSAGLDPFSLNPGSVSSGQSKLRGGAQRFDPGA
jgi:hypothetical protein